MQWKEKPDWPGWLGSKNELKNDQDFLMRNDKGLQGGCTEVVTTPHCAIVNNRVGT
jgi:hypothetical protein